MTSESEGEVEVASPAGQEGGKLSDDQLNWLMPNIICWQHIYIFTYLRIYLYNFLGEGEEGLDWEYEELPEGAGGDQ